IVRPEGILFPEILLSSSSAGGQLEQPSDVNSSTRIGAAALAAAPVAAAVDCDVSVPCAPAITLTTNSTPAVSQRMLFTLFNHRPDSASWNTPVTAHLRFARRSATFASHPVETMVNSLRMPATEITVSKEDYLKAIIEAESEGHTVIPAFLAQWLGVSAPAVTKALRRLREDGYVNSATDGPLKLTVKGREAAHRTALRHHLVERMLSEVFGMEWHQIHAEAERLEHVISPAFEAKLIERLGEEGEC